METREIAALAPLIVAGAAFVVFCLVDIGRREPKHLPRWAWVVLTVVSIPLGGVLYLLLGRGEPREVHDHD